MARDTVSSRRKKNNPYAVTDTERKEFIRRNKSKGSFTAKQLNSCVSRNNGLLNSFKSKVSEDKSKSKANYKYSFRSSFDIISCAA